MVAVVGAIGLRDLSGTEWRDNQRGKTETPTPASTMVLLKGHKGVMSIATSSAMGKGNMNPLLECLKTGTYKISAETDEMNYRAEIKQQGLSLQRLKGMTKRKDVTTHSKSR